MTRSEYVTELPGRSTKLAHGQGQRVDAGGRVGVVMVYRKWANEERTPVAVAAHDEARVRRYDAVVHITGRKT